MKKLLFSALMLSASIYSAKAQLTDLGLGFPTGTTEWHGGEVPSVEGAGKLVITYSETDQYQALTYPLNNGTSEVSMDLRNGAYIAVWASSTTPVKLRIDLASKVTPDCVCPQNRAANKAGKTTSKDLTTEVQGFTLAKQTVWQQSYSGPAGAFDPIKDGPVDSTQINQIQIFAVPTGTTYTGVITIDSIYISSMPIALNIDRPQFVSASTSLFPTLVENELNVNYSLVSSAKMKLVLNSAVGNQVTVLSEGSKNPGLVQEKFNIAGLTSGVYFVSFEVDGATVKTEKLMVK